MVVKKRQAGSGQDPGAAQPGLDQCHHANRFSPTRARAVPVPDGSPDGPREQRPACYLHCCMARYWAIPPLPTVPREARALAWTAAAVKLNNI